MYFTSNHDENSWNTADYATMPGAIHAPFVILSQTYHRTMPLIYSGQEAPVLLPIQFFEKDPMPFGKYKRAPFYSTLLHLRQSNKAFGEGAKFNRLKVNNPDAVMAYQRVAENDKVVVVLNLSNQMHQVQLQMENGENIYTDLFTKQNVQNINQFELLPWGYKVFVKTNPVVKVQK